MSGENIWLCETQFKPRRESISSDTTPIYLPLTVPTAKVLLRGKSRCCDVKSVFNWELTLEIAKMFDLLISLPNWGPVHILP